MKQLANTILANLMFTFYYSILVKPLTRLNTGNCFQELFNHNVSPIYCFKTVIVMHINQTLQVKWKSKIKR